MEPRAQELQQSLLKKQLSLEKFSVNPDPQQLNLLRKITIERDSVRRLYLLRILANTELPVHLAVALSKAFLAGRRKKDLDQVHHQKEQSRS